ncbi:hypothetical protein [Streptomyces sp. S4.7]|uniref:hypothetical protein n=1 Tax=Streptomyces sp. S4.7 TaxID=2705439 RepID=UPI0031BA4EC1
MNAAPALLGYAAAVGVLAPRVMLRSAWPHRAPVPAATVWFALALSFSVCAALGALHLATPGAHLHGILYSCGAALGVGPPDAGAVRSLDVAVSVAVPAAQVAAFTYHVLRARAARARHREISTGWAGRRRGWAPRCWSTRPRPPTACRAAVLGSW